MKIKMIIIKHLKFVKGKSNIEYAHCFYFKMNFVAAHCQRSKDLWLRMLAECEQRQTYDLITTCYNNRKSFIYSKKSFHSKVHFHKYDHDLVVKQSIEEFHHRK